MSRCYLCNVGLSGGLDTFGGNEYPMCVACWLEMAEERVATDQQYAEALKLFSEAQARKDWDAADAAYHQRYAGMIDTPVGFRRI